ncbi:MAG: glycosyltransferase, partial [Candidatus Marsarchaeota archaeon]|nr:glycosyltransferase [Candidatus Marsarchaeota archaeon]
MKPFVSLIHNNWKHVGVSKYNYEVISRTKKLMPVNDVELKEVQSGNKVERIVNILKTKSVYTKELIKQKAKLSEVNHFLNLDVFYYVKELEGKRVVCTAHDFSPLEAVQKSTYKLDGIVRKIFFLKRFESAVKHADFFITDSKLTERQLIKQGVERKRIKIINLGVDEKFKILKKHDSRQNIIGYLGNNKDIRKRIGKLVEDWKGNKIEKFKLTLAGPGIKNAHFDSNFNIDYIGELPDNKVISYYNSLKAFMLPSSSEGFGFNVIEAVACGTPVFIYKDALS